MKSEIIGLLYPGGEINDNGVVLFDNRLYFRQSAPGAFFQQDIHAAAAREVKTVPALLVSAGIGTADFREIAFFDACQTVIKPDG